MDLQQLNEIADEIKLVYGVYYGYDDNDNYVDIDDGTPCPPERDYRDNHFRIYCNISTGDIWLCEFTNCNSYNRYKNRHIKEITWYEIESYLIDRHIECQYLDGEILRDFIDDLREGY